MSKRTRRRKADRLVETNYWEGFWGRMGRSPFRERVLSYSLAPAWWDEVADIAHVAGYDDADEMIQVATSDRRFGMGHQPVIAARVYADAHAAADRGRER